MSSRPPRILISAGEASGDRLGAGLARALLARRPDLELIGMGGDQMAEAGVRVVQDASEIAVVGLFEVFRHLGAIRRAMRRMADCLEQERPDLVVPIDFPDFNFRLASRARAADIGVVYYVSPQVWAWRRGRVQTLKRLVRRMLVLFPFEVPVYEEAGVPVTFVGYPLRPPQVMSREELYARTGLEPERPAVALVPGSRRLEIERHLPPMLGAARRLLEERRELQFLLPRAPGVDPSWIDAQIGPGDPRPVVHAGDFPAVLDLCEAGAVASGTASLESALAGLPMVVVYRTSGATYLLARALVRVDHIALPNLVAGRRVVPELIQRDCNAEHLARELARYLDRPQEAARVREDLAAVGRDLGGPGGFERAADAILGEL